ncbi:MAG: 50S ribosomal protein L3 N(5)-glutamine methyltransferase [Xanthomonadales bacterium]|nr:50S ribosomal protein L3 N(5)-glutamine methyltransferase [Xanthomonadales bacterium]
MKDFFKQTVDHLSEQDVFYGHGVEEAEDEVLLLFMSVLNVDFSELNEMAKAKMKPGQQNKVNNLVKKRVQQKIPMAYLVGFSVFAGLKFRIDERALIPRSPFVELIDSGFMPWMDMSQSTKVLDLCTGSGCIGLAIAHYFSQAQVDLVDLSEAALDLARENTELLELGTQCHLIHSDLFSNVSGCYDLIVTNPPYVAEQEYQDLPQEYSHEPKMALVSQLEGMEIPVNILFQAVDYLNEDGFLFLEVGYNDAVLTAVLPEVAFDWIDFTVGGQGICVFSRSDLLKYRENFKQFLEEHVA